MLRNLDGELFAQEETISDDGRIVRALPGDLSQASLHAIDPLAFTNPLRPPDQPEREGKDEEARHEPSPYVIELARADQARERSG